MKNSLRIFFLFLIAINLFSQSSDYFPLEVGNQWTYKPSWDTSASSITYSVDKKISINDFEYFLYGMAPYYDTLRNNGSGVVYKLIKNKEHLWFDFTIADRDTYHIPIHYSQTFDTWVVTVTRNVEAETHLGTFKNCIELFFDIPHVIDEEHIYVFAPNVGIVKRYGAWENRSLVSAIINGEMVTNIPNAGIPGKFVLHQNYPNPFNPSTKIKFTISSVGATHELSEQQFVTLKVYDILGNEITTLVNEMKKPGTYEVKFDSRTSDFTLISGVYFYRLMVGNYLTTKKMVLIR